MISLRSGTSGYGGCAPMAIGGVAAGADRHREVFSGHLLAQQRRVALQRLVDLRVRHPHPPREQRVVAVVEGEPLGGDRAQLLDRGRPEDRLIGVDPRRRRPQPGDLLGDVGDRRRRLAARSCPRRGCALPPAARSLARTAPPSPPVPASSRPRRAARVLLAIVADSLARSDFASAVSRDESRRPSAACQFASKRFSLAMRAGETGTERRRRR